MKFKIPIGCLLLILLLAAACIYSISSLTDRPALPETNLDVGNLVQGAKEWLQNGNLSGLDIEAIEEGRQEYLATPRPTFVWPKIELPEIPLLNDKEITATTIITANMAPHINSWETVILSTSTPPARAPTLKPSLTPKPSPTATAEPAPTAVSPPTPQVFWTESNMAPPTPQVEK